MKILFVVDQLPYPPRNGVTIPTFNHMSRLALKEEVSLLLLTGNAKELDEKQLAENKKYVNRLWVVERTRRSKAVRILDELNMRSPYSLGWVYNVHELKKYLGGGSFDVVWASPFNAIDAIQTIRPLLRTTPVYVAGINDCKTSVYKNMRKKLLIGGLDVKTRVSFALGWLRSWLVARIEANLLRNFDLILVQTNIEKKWLHTISSGELDGRTLVVPNGVNETLSQIPIRFKDKNLLFFGSVGDEYKGIIFWIVQNVWPRIAALRKDLYFYIIGRNASINLRKRLALDKRIIYIEFIADIQKVFDDKAVMLAPVFKQYGLINKVVEAMAAGVPVVGDAGSFNGITGFQNGRQGIVAKDAESMAQAVLRILDSRQMYCDIAQSARDLIKKQFIWDRKVTMVNKELRLLMKNRNKNRSST